MKNNISFFSHLLFFQVATGQAPASFCLNLHDQYATCYFSKDNIYFVASNNLVKTDYAGNVIWAKLGVFNSLVFDENNFYSLNGNLIYKSDTSGNVIWARDISSSVCPLGVGFSNYNTGIALHDERIYISSSQQNFTSGMTGYNSLLTMDTSGAVISSWCDPVASFNTNYIDKGFGSISGGAWFIFRHGGVGIEESIVKMDYNGNIDLMSGSVELDMGVSIKTRDIITLKDSNYLAICNVDPNGMGTSNSDYHSGLSKFTENGNVLWQKQISASPFSDTSFYVYGATNDSANNIYMSGYSGGDTWQGGRFFMKLDQSGNILFVKNWSDAQLSSIFSDGKLFYHNGYVYSFLIYNDAGQYKPTIMVFDTILTTCNVTDSLGSVPMVPDLIANGGLPPFPLASYIQVNDTVTLSNTVDPLISDLCVVLLSRENIKNDKPVIFPNPFVKNINVEWAEGEMAILDFFNLAGEKVFEKKIWRSQSIDLSDFPSGVYQFRITSHSMCMNKKIIKL